MVVEGRWTGRCPGNPRVLDMESAWACNVGDMDRNTHTYMSSCNLDRTWFLTLWGKPFWTYSLAWRLHGLHGLVTKPVSYLTRAQMLAGTVLEAWATARSDAGGDGVTAWGSGALQGCHGADCGGWSLGTYLQWG